MADEAGDTGLDIEATAEAIGKELFPPVPVESEEEPVEAAGEESPAETVEAKPPVTPPVTSPMVRAVPKSWPKEMHEHWPKVDPKVQEYWETREKQMLDGLDQYKDHASFGKSLREVLSPYRPIIEAAGIDEAKAVQTLLNAHYRLTQGSLDQRQLAYQELGKNLGLAKDEQAAAVDPTTKALQDRLNALETSLTSREQATFVEAQTRVANEVEVFASDPAHTYFDEVADDIVAMIRSGASLQEAYDKAVWANPVTREKEYARRLADDEKKHKENARLDALKAKQAASVNVRGRETRRAPTEPLGSMEETMKQTLADIRARVH